MEHEYPHDHWCTWREMYVRAEDDLQRANARIERLQQELRDAAFALNAAERDSIMAWEVGR